MKPEQFLERFSTHLKNVIARAISIASSMRHTTVTPLHVVAALTQEQGAVGAILLSRFHVETKTLIEALPPAAEIPRKQPIPTTTLPELNHAAKHMLERAMLLAYERHHAYVGTEHLLYGILCSRYTPLNQILKECGVDKKQFMQELETILSGATKLPDKDTLDDTMEHIHEIMESQPLSGQSDMPAPSKPQRAMDLFTTDLTGKEAQKRIDPVIGRDREIERLIHILCRRTKNNPILVGEPGVGKTAIVEGLAKKVVEGHVPPILQGKKILSLDMTLLIAGTIYRGEFEARIKQLMDELAKESETILFIDEIHTIIGAGANQGSMDAANILKPALARGQLRCIGATTHDEYERHITTDPALERRFQKIYIDEPTVEQTVEILKGIKKSYENFHNVTILDDAITAAAKLSYKYIHETHLPDKAIDLIDEAAAAARAARKIQPWEKMYYTLMTQAEHARQEKESAIGSEQFDQALVWKEKEQDIQKKVDTLRKESEKKKQGNRLKINASDVALIVSKRLSVDPKQITDNEFEQLSVVQTTLNSEIFGQNHVIDAVMQILRHASIGLPASTKPRASFLFAGPSGVGKTALAKALAKALFHTEKALITFNMGEFAEAHSVSKLLGSPAGYIGHRERNRFTDELRKRPHAVVLFDEFDKAHKDVQTLLFQILDEGILTDSHGKKIILKDAVIILTTTLGAEIYRNAGIGFGVTNTTPFLHTRQRIQKKLKEELDNALLARLHGICIFHPLSMDVMRQIVQKQLDRLSNHLQTTRSLQIQPDDAAIETLASSSYSEDAGARNVETIMREMVHDLVAEVISKPRRKKSYRLTAANARYKLV